MNVAEATRKINAILAELERDCGSVVESISLDRVEVTTMESATEEFVVTVCIDLRRLPSQSWNV